MTARIDQSNRVAGVTVRLVLASASPSRRELLHRAGVEPTVHVSDVDEDAILERAVAAYGPLEPADVALTLARAKAEDVTAQLAGLSEATADAIVLGCDSVLELDGQALGKPGTAERATERWRAMRGRTGILHTGHWVVDDREPDAGGTGGTLGATASTPIRFAEVTDEEIAAYVASGEPLGVAGAFTLEGRAAPYIEGIEGDPSNVMGLSLPLLRLLLAELDIPWPDVLAT
ncbi:Maf family protein [Nostocoides japonicum]|uniref:Maf family protein n=1 Tax=Nostocoides japonicum TaxID=99481 RepID=UPI00065BEB67